MKKLMILALATTMVFVGCQNKTDETKNSNASNPVAEQALDKVEDADKAVDAVDEKEDSQKVEGDHPLSGVTLDAFETEDYDGNAVTEEIFKDKDLTVLNLWANWCGPCLSEMPDFEKVSQAYADKNVQILGLAVDSDTDEVKAIQKKLKITYPLIKENKALKSMVSSNFDYVPVTLFVDSEGKVLNTFIAGSASEKELIKAIEDALNE